MKFMKPLFDENDIRPPHLMEDKRKCVDADREFLLKRKAEWAVVSCPACGADSGRIYGEKQGFLYEECKSCATVYTNPRPSQQLMHDFYVQSQNYEYWNKHIFSVTEETRRNKIFYPRAGRLRDICHSNGITSGTFLEIGAAFGIFCEEVQ